MDTVQEAGTGPVESK